MSVAQHLALRIAPQTAASPFITALSSFLGRTFGTGEVRVGEVWRTVSSFEKFIKFFSISVEFLDPKGRAGRAGVEQVLGTEVGVGLVGLPPLPGFAAGEFMEDVQVGVGIFTLKLECKEVCVRFRIHYLYCLYMTEKSSLETCWHFILLEHSGVVVVVGKPIFLVLGIPKCRRWACLQIVDWFTLGLAPLFPIE